jgi:hypothetical protein
MQERTFDMIDQLALLWPLSDEEAAQKIVSLLRDLETERKTGGIGEDLLSCVFENLADEVSRRRRLETLAGYAREKAFDELIFGL